jgi:hypothetical protein
MWSWSPLIADGFLDRVLEAADRILNLARDLLCLAFGFELGVTSHFARDLLSIALGLLHGAFDSIFVHVFLSLLASAPQQKDYNNDYQYRAEAPTKIMVRRTEIETTATKNENQNNQE